MNSSPSGTSGLFGRPVALSFVAAAVLASWAFPLEGPGIGIFLGVIAVAGAVVASRSRPIGALEVVYGCLGLLLASMTLFRDAAWIVVPCLLFAAALGALTMAGGTGFGGVAAGIAAPLGRLHRVPGSVLRSLTSPQSSAPGNFSPARAVGLTAFLIILFGALFYSADAAFAHFVSRLLPEAPSELPLRLFLFFAALFYGVSVALTGPRHLGAPFDGIVSAAETRLASFKQDGDFRGRNREWMIGLSGLLVLFAAFLAVQARVLFGGHDYVQRTVGLTYAEYARQGFFQLLLVGFLTLAVLAAARLLTVWDGDDRRLLRGLSGALIVLALVVLASAFNRLALYEQAFGFSRARVAGHALTLWLAGIFLLVVLAAISGLGRRLAVAIVVFTGLALLGFALYNPDARIAEANIARFKQTGKVDLAYLGGLSFDAAPQLLTLPRRVRDCLFVDRPLPESWSSFNFSKAAGEKLRLYAGRTTPERCARLQSRYASESGRL